MIANQQDQVSRAIEPVEGEEYRHDDGIAPLMPFPTSYALNRDQEEELVSHAMKRLLELEREMGRDVCEGGNWWNGDGLSVGNPLGTDGPETSWMGKRLLYDKTFKNEMDWRPRLLGGIFAESNLVVPAARRICRQMIARAVNYFFGTAPWFSLYPVGSLDKTRADKGDRYTRWKMDRAKLQRTLEQGIERAFIVGEAVVKTAWAQREQIYKTTATVLVDAAGMDILGADGDYILDSDLWIQDGAEDPATGEMVLSDLVVLKRDGKTPQPMEMIWQEKLITRRIVHYKGPEAKVIHFMDFLCPLESPTIQEADCVVHLYDMPLMTLADQWKKSAAASATAEERVEGTRKATELLRRLSAGDGQSTSGQNSDAVDNVTQASSRDSRSQPIVKVAEFNLTYDIDGEGLRNIILIVDRESRTPIFYDFDANITADGLRPYSCERVNEIPGRWYGMGAMEMMNPSQQIIDLWMNRKNKAVSQSARVDFWKPHNTVEGQANPNLEVNWGGTYTPKGNNKADDCLESVYLEDNIGDKLMELIEFMMQIMMNESGIANANDGNVSGMDSTKLATGIRNIEKSGQELFSLFLGHLEPGITDCLGKMVKLTFSRLDEIEVYRYFEGGEAGGEGAEELVEINPGDISQMEIDVQILMTRSRGEQILESSLRAWETVEKYFDPTKGPEFQERVAPMAIDILKALQIQNAKDIIRPLTMPMPGMAPEGQLDAQGMLAAVTPQPRQAPANL
jgi:hypothetical protein